MPAEIRAELDEDRMLSRHFGKGRTRMTLNAEGYCAWHDGLLKAQFIARIGSWQLMLADGGLSWTPEMYRIFGLSQSEPQLAGAARARIHPDDAEKVQAAWVAALRGAPYELEHRLLVDGEVRWVHCRADISFDGDGKPISAIGTTQDISDRRIVNQLLQEQHDRYSAIFSQSCDGIVLVDADTTRFVEFNDAACQNLGYGRDEFSRMTVPDIEAKESSDEVSEHRRRMVQRGGDVFETRHRCKSGEIRDVRVSSRVLVLHGKQYISAIFSDITESRQNEDKLRLLSTVFAHGGEAIAITDSNNNILEVNDSFTRLTGYTTDDVRGKNPRVLASGLTPRETYQQMWESIQQRGYWQGEVWDKHKSGHVYPKLLTITVVRDSHGHVMNYVASFTDITKRLEAEQQAYYLAYHDALTGLPNRANLRGRLEQSLASALRQSKQVAVMFLDLDRFKAINDSLGHGVGDDLLVEVANRLKSAVRDSDTVARLGGDEFVLVLTDADVDGAAHVAGKVLDMLGQPFLLSGKELYTSSSIGICLYPDDGGNAEELMRHADSAMYFAKSQGRGNYQFYTSDMNRRAVDRVELEAELREAIHKHQLLLHYQPQIDMASGRICGVEALVRWNHPKRGMVSPMAFIPIAEETGLINVLGTWVLNEACRELSCWHQQGVTGVRMAINLSARQLRQSNLLDIVARALMDHHLIGEDLELELTESVVMQDPAVAIDVFKDLRSMGVHLAIDDFGTGYSSLSYLKVLPINRLKLDRSFVKDIEHDPNDAAISAATIALAHNLGLQVIAEGVETIEQQEFLRKKQCDQFQGFVYSKPLPAEAILAMLKEAVFQQK